jgi:hypothetical protein
MSKKIGHDYNRDPYPWDGAEKLDGSADWTCCNLRLPSTYFICPLCGNDRKLDDVNLLSVD